MFTAGEIFLVSSEQAIRNKSQQQTLKSDQE